MTDDSEYELVMPFVAVQSRGGPYDDEAYVAGCEMGMLDRDLVNNCRSDGPILATSREQADLIAMHRGYWATFTPTDDDTWVHAVFLRATGTVIHPRPGDPPA